MSQLRAISLAILCSTVAAFGQQPDDDPDRRCVALCDAADQGRFDVAAALVALGGDDESVAATAAAIVRHEWVELPRELFEGLEQERTAMRRMLLELARGPRRAARSWAERQALPTFGRTLDHRLLALAARGEPLGPADAGLLLEALRQREIGDGFHLCLQLLPERVADGLVGRLHQELSAGAIAVEQLTFVFDRLSPRGIMALLGLAVSLPESVATVLVRDVFEHRPELVHERAAAALDSANELESVWLGYCGPLLDRPARVERLKAILLDADDEARRELAFEALLAGKVVDREVLEVAIGGGAGGNARLLRLLSRAGDAVPAAFLADCLGGETQVANEAARALLQRRVMEPVVLRRVSSLLDDVEAADRGMALDLVTAVMLLGDETAVEKVWPVALGSPAWAELLDRFARRSEPFVTARLRAELAAASERRAAATGDAVERLEQQRDLMALMLCRRGERAELERLVQRAATAPLSFVRRCRLDATPLPPAESARVFAAALASEDPERAVDLLEWAATDVDRDNLQRFEQLWRAPPETDAGESLVEVAVRVLAGSGARPELVAALHEAWADGPLPEAWSALPFELLDTCRADAASGVAPDDLELCAELCLLPALADPVGEARRVARWPDGGFGFPLVTAIATRLRAARPDAAAEAFARVVTRVLADERSGHVSQQRLKVLWRALAATPELLRAVGTATAPLWPGADAHGQAIDPGPGLWFCALHAEQCGDLEAAEGLYRRAGRALLRRPASRQEARWLLGERDVDAGTDPWSELAAAPYRVQVLRARAAGDAVAELRAQRLVDEFAGHAREPLADPSRENHR